MRTVRVGLGLLGAGIAAYGVWQLVWSGVDNVRATLWWLAGGVVVHDVLLAPATVTLGVVAARTLPTWLRGPAAAGLLVLGSVTLLAVPVLGRFGARPDNPSLLDRNYGVGWLAFAALVVVVACAWAAVRRREGKRSR